MPSFVPLRFTALLLKNTNGDNNYSSEFSRFCSSALQSHQKCFVSVLRQNGRLPLTNPILFGDLSHWRHFGNSDVLNSIVPFTLSDIGEGITEVTVKEWFVKVGDKVAQFDNICEVQSDKASVTITSRYDGVISKLHYEVDQVAKVGKPLVDIQVEGSSNDTEGSSIPETSSSDTDSDSEKDKVFSNNQRGKALATPAVRRIAAEHKIDLSLVQGSGKGGRVMKEDILAHVSDVGPQRPSSEVYPQTSKTIVTSPQPSVTKSLSMPLAADKVVPITGYTKTMVKTMTAANAVPHFVYSDELNLGPLIDLRLRLKQPAEKRSIKLTFMPFFIKAASVALTQFPSLNASVNTDCTEVTYKARHNIGFAMDTSNGLVVPNIKDVQLLPVLDVAREMNRLTAAGISGSLAPKDVTGGTFSLSNIGSIGGTYTKPVLLVPEVAIGALGRIQKLPRFGANGAIEEANIVCVSWAADHRVVDGATVARFSNLFKELIENPLELLL